MRRQEILDAAMRLFIERGYDGTSVNDILEATGLSKGAFYHHFESKTEVLEALVEKMGDQGVAQAEALLEQADDSIPSKLNAFFQGGNRYKLANVDGLRNLIRVYNKEENWRLRQRGQEKLIEKIIPILARVLSEGKRRGEFRIDDPSETARVLMHLASLINDAFAAGIQMKDRAAAIVMCRTRIRTCESAIERLLGLLDQSFVIVPPDMIEAFFNISEGEQTS